VSRFFDAVRRADASRQRPRDASGPGPLAPLPPEARPHRVLAVASNKGGVGKTTIATNLAVYLRALHEDLPILLLGLDDQPTIDRMFAIEPGASAQTLADALRGRSLAEAIRVGNYGVHYVPTSSRIAELKREICDPTQLVAELSRSGFAGLVVIDTKSDLEILTQNALAAADLTLVLARDLVSLGEAQKVFDLLEAWGRPRESARVLLSLVDLRVRFASGEAPNLHALLRDEIRRRGYPALETFVSASPKVESLTSNPERAARSILHAAASSLVHRQMQSLAEEVLRLLPRGGPATSARAAEPPPAEPPPLRPLGIDVSGWPGVEPPRKPVC
jgi:cellulose biosynthesis protein BcsQ